jgi:protein involved in polysaccharide export with SLBB domain
MRDALTQRLELHEPRRLAGHVHLGWCLVFLVTAAASGCAALTNPVADAIPVRRLPPEVLGPSREDLVPIPLTLLEQPRSAVSRVTPGDVLGVWVEGILGDRTVIPPVFTAPQVEMRDQRRLPPAMGYPVSVREDGTIALPLINPVSVAGRTLAEVEEALRQAYTTPKQLLQPGTERIVVTLLQGRQHHIVVLREEASSFSPVGVTGVVLTGKRGTGQAIALVSGENDVLHALALTGGLPGLDTYDEVVIQHACFQEGEDVETVRRQIESGSATSSACVHIPLRIRPGNKLLFAPADVVLHSGDVVYLRARDGEVFYTGGLLPSGEHVLPRDRDLDVVEAVSATRGPLVNGAFVNNNLAGNLINPGIGFDSPALLVVVRRLPDGGQLPIRVDLNQALRDPRERIAVQPGDLLILQELPNYALARYMGTTLFNINLTYIPFFNKSLVGAGDMSTLGTPARIGVGNFNTAAVIR